MTVGSSIRSLLPSWHDYRAVKRTWRGDIVAGITVGIVALPLALAFGVSSGAGAESGLITAIIAGVVAAVFGGSNIQVSGPTGAMVVVLGPVVVAHGAGVVALVSLGAGIVVVVAGALRLGRVVSYIPWPVIEGFTLGIAVIIFLQQVPPAIGATAGKSSNAVVAAVESFASVKAETVAWAIGAVAVVAVVMILAPRIHPKLPGSLVAIVLVSVTASLAHLPLARIGALPSSLPAPTLPAIDLATLGSLVGPIFTVAALAAIESLLSARVGAALADTGTYDPDRELVGQGLASVASGFFGGMLRRTHPARGDHPFLRPARHRRPGLGSGVGNPPRRTGRSAHGHRNPHGVGGDDAQCRRFHPLRHRRLRAHRPDHRVIRPDRGRGYRHRRRRVLRAAHTLEIGGCAPGAASDPCHAR
jgi:SulP family sulfate permease